ncbi:MAG: tetratricopeptide repeat protein [Myxococcales bacterium]|nr:MAG: tetratricopeptide repeat protein [Myxococcales bacterium]
MIRSLMEDGPSFEGHLRYRFPMWVFNYLAQLGFGNHEATFFLPTWLLSSLLPVLAYGTLRAAGYGLAGSLFAGAFVALSPFEVLIGALRANDLFVEFFLACAFWSFVRFERAPRSQGASVALALWLAFYAKLWSLFLYPVVGVHYLVRLVRERDGRGLVAFVGTSLVLHAAACAFWRGTTNTWTPFLEHLSATYPVSADQLSTLFLEYPRAIFVGSEHGNTLFGLVPYLLVGGLGLSIFGRRVPALAARAPRIALDRYDVWLLCSCLVFFGLLELFPNNFTFDRYYSVPRIFRYLAPLSFGLSLFAAKLLVDLGQLVPARLGLRWIAALGVLVLLASGTLEAVAPGRSHHARVAALREELRTSCPPVVMLELRQAIFFRELHLRVACPGSVVLRPPGIHQTRDYERWLQELEPRLPTGAVLVTGLIQFVYYACYICGPRLSHFEAALDPRWSLVRELAPVGFDPAREPVRLWRWSGRPLSAEGEVVPVPALAPPQLFERGIERFDAQDYPGTRAWMRALLDRFPGHALESDAAYFVAVTYWRERDPQRTSGEFEAFLAQFPSSRLRRAAHYHIGLSHRMLGHYAAAKAAFEATVRSSEVLDPEREYALQALGSLHGPAPLDAAGRGLTELVYRFQAQADRLGTRLGASEP